MKEKDMKDNSYDQLLTLDQVVVQAGEYHLALTFLQDENKDTEQLLARTALMLTLGMIIKKHIIVFIISKSEI